MSCGRKALTDKVLVLGVDGFEPSLAKKFMDQGKMPALKKFVERGSAREDLMLLGCMPTVTPPMWTTLATGAYAGTHGITGFFNPHPEKCGVSIYALDSRMCKAEPFWNVSAEAGKKTMVWHWPGSSWPPTSDNPNLYVVDGTQPGAVNMGVAIIDWEGIVSADENVEKVIFAAHDAPNNPGAGCIITDVGDVAEEDEGGKAGGINGLTSVNNKMEISSLLFDESDTEVAALSHTNLDITNSPIKPAKGWANAPADAKEFTILTSKGYTRRPALILKNEDGIYDHIAIYKSKKDLEPIAVLKNDEYYADYVDEVKVNEENMLSNRCMRILELAEDGSKIRLWMSNAYDVHKDSVFHPKKFFEQIIENVGYVPPISSAPGTNTELVAKAMIPSWEVYCQWQADALNYVMDEGFEVIFSHLHNVDIMGHQMWHLARHRDDWGNDETFYQGAIQEIYEQTDRYLARFLDALDNGWTIIITSDHGLITEEHQTPGLGEVRLNAINMVEMGYTVLKKDENGNPMREIDWRKTRAVAHRSCHIEINLKGRYETGIVDPADKDALEDQIITDLYNYKDPITGERVVALALKNKDAVLLGMNGPECGDIVFFMAEGYNIIHADSLSTQKGYFDTSVSPIFVAAGPGIKENYKCERVIRQVDVAPTVAALTGLRMPAQCEGAPAYQILTEDF
ncbi:MAG: alkaline phosphatase family protein [Peptococcaceae bacterium]|nr:alkaline phosphatase family protein [Peptococcaceae bacterium]